MPPEPFFLWWASQPEIREVEARLQAEIRHERWSIEKTKNRLAQQEEKLQRRGFTQRQIALVKRLAGVQPDDLERELSLSH